MHQVTKNILFFSLSCLCMQIYSDDHDNFVRFVHVYIDGLHFVNDEMSSDWYDGDYELHVLSIRTKKLRFIHANAFKETVLRYLYHLELSVERGTVQISANAFDGMQNLRSIRFIAEHVESFPIGLLEPIAAQVLNISFLVWPNSTNLNEMFTRAAFRLVKSLEISDVLMPQANFRVLAAANFTTFRRLAELYLIDCGIEVIEDNAFDAIGHTLVFLHLGNNRFTAINIPMIRNIFESKSFAKLVINFDFYPLCTCALVAVDVMLLPQRRYNSELIMKCQPIDADFDASACGLYRDVDISDICVIQQKSHLFVRIISVSLAYHAGILVVQTKFRYKARIILVDLNGMRSGSCVERGSRENYRCLQSDKLVGRFELLEMTEFRYASFVSITVIPILLRFGSRHVHTITVRQPQDDVDWLCDYVVGVMIGIIIFSGIIGFGLGVLIEHCQNNSSVDHLSAAAKRPSYDYIMTDGMTENGVDSYDYADNNYIAVY